MTILEVNPQFWGSWCWPMLLAGLFSGLASINTWGSSGVDGNDDFNQWLGLTIGNQWWQPMMGLIGAGLLWYRWRNLLQRTWRFLDDAISLPVSILWVGSLARSSSRSFVHALTWGINLAIMTNVRAMSTIQQTWGMFEATWDETMCKMMAISSWKSCFKTEPTSDTFFFLTCFVADLAICLQQDKTVSKGLQAPVSDSNSERRLVTEQQDQWLFPDFCISCLE